MQSKYMKKFSFLSQHSYFKPTKKPSEFDESMYRYVYKEGETKCAGHISVDHNLRTIYWSFEEENVERYSKYKKIEATPEWFQDLYDQAERKRKQLVRLRDLFSAKEISGKGKKIQDFFIGITKGYEK